VRLTGPALVAVLAILAVGLPVLLVLTWRRRPHGVAGAALRLVAVLLSQVLAIAAAGAIANNTFGFYNSWDDLLGTQNQAPQAPAANGLVPADGSLGSVVALSVALPGVGYAAPVGKHASVLVWLPKEYDQPQFHDAKFPVVMMLPGQPGTPQGVFSQFDFGRQATAAIDQQRVKPFIAVIPPIMIDPPRDTECTDVPDGPQAETWLARDVRNAVLKHFRVSAAAGSWSAMGWSTGGFCAAKLMLRHRDLFNAAVGVGAYYDAETDHTTGDLFKGNADLRNQNSPIWMVGHARDQRTNLLIIASRFDHSSWDGLSYADSKRMVEETQGVPGVSTIVLRQGGHNFHVYRPTIPEAFAWLGENAGL
jgi:enterochelin esterase-like enzyme